MRILYSRFAVVCAVLMSCGLLSPVQAQQFPNGRPPDNLVLPNVPLAPECIDYKDEPMTARDLARGIDGERDKKTYSLMVSELHKVPKVRCANYKAGSPK
jgi:hypothetical protein